jgi:hypothetical protein
MKYIVLTYEGGDQQMCIEAIGPETVIGIVTDVMRGNYNEGQKRVTKIEAGDQMDHGYRMSIAS